MDTRIHLFGRFRLVDGDGEAHGLPTRRAEELLSYLILNPRRLHSREAMAALFWEHASPVQSRKYLRHALWQVQSALGGRDGRGSALRTEPEWIGLSAESRVWIDVRHFEDVVARVLPQNGAPLSDAGARLLEEAVGYADAELLSGWSCEWCLADRERLQQLVLAVLDRLVTHAETHACYQEAIAFGQRALSWDRARERSHRDLMRLHYVAGDRTAALRQYERCVAALDHELGVAPARSTVALFEDIRADQLRAQPAVPGAAGLGGDALALRHLDALLAETRARVEDGLSAMERALRPGGPVRPDHAG